MPTNVRLVVEMIDCNKQYSLLRNGEKLTLQTLNKIVHTSCRLDLSKVSTNNHTESESFRLKIMKIQNIKLKSHLDYSFRDLCCKTLKV
jgi:hypothetical protein